MQIDLGYHNCSKQWYFENAVDNEAAHVLYLPGAYKIHHIFFALRHINSGFYDTAGHAHLHQAVVTADKRRQSRSVEHNVRAKQARACDTERAGSWVKLSAVFLPVDN